MKVVVTGANGFLGSWLVRALVQEGCEVHALVRPSSDLSELKGIQCIFDHGDVNDPTSLQKAFEGADTVFHLAGVVAYSKAQRSLMDKVNVEGTAHVVDAALQCKVRRLVFLSSVTAIGASDSPKKILNETSPYEISHLNLGYFETKKQAEAIVMTAVRERALNAVILNPSTIYGPGDAKKGSRKTQLKVAQGRFPYYPSGGVSIISVKDAVTGIIQGWKKGRSGERYILSGENILVKDLFKMIAEAAGANPPTKALPNFVMFLAGAWGDLKQKFGKSSSVSMENYHTATMYHWFDNTKARRELGINPAPAREAIRDSVGWMREQGLLEKKP